MLKFIDKLIFNCYYNKAFVKMCLTRGGLAQLARAPALQAGGHRFEPDILHHSVGMNYSRNEGV